MGYLYYCPYCGRVVDRSDYMQQKHCICKSTPIIGPKLLPTTITYEELDSYKIHGRRPDTIRALTYDMYKAVWEQYVENPNNTKLIPAKYEDEKRIARRACGMEPNPGSTAVQSYMNKQQGIVSCPKCGSQSISTVKQGFGVGKAVAGVIAAGPEGALAGAVGANKVLNVCQNCGHQWEPGK